MKNLFFVLCFCFIVLPVSAYSTPASKFAESEYAKTNNCQKVRINMKKEYCNDYNLKTDKRMIIKVVYGWGDMKIKGCKKHRVTYVVLFDAECKPYWSSVNFYDYK